MAAGVAAVARHTLLELGRRRLLVLFAVLEGLLVIGVGIAPLVVGRAPGEETVLFVISTMSGVAGGAILLCAIGVGMTVIRNDIDSGAIVAILAKPISRVAYTGGKLTAAALLLVAVDALIGGATIGLLTLHGGGHVGVVFMFFAVLAANAVIWMVMVMALTVYMHNVLAAVVVIALLFMQGVFGELHTLIQTHVVVAQPWITLSEVGYWALPRPLATALERELVQSSLHLHPASRPPVPLSAIPSPSGPIDVMVWLSYLVVACGLLFLALRRKQV